MSKSPPPPPPPSCRRLYQVISELFTCSFQIFKTFFIDKLDEPCPCKFELLTWWWKFYSKRQLQLHKHWVFLLDLSRIALRKEPFPYNRKINDVFAGFKGIRHRDPVQVNIKVLNFIRCLVKIPWRLVNMKTDDSHKIPLFR